MRPLRGLATIPLPSMDCKLQTRLFMEAVNDLTTHLCGIRPFAAACSAACCRR